jgi:hypothetical protein
MTEQILPAIGQDLLAWATLNMLLSLGIAFQAIRTLRFTAPAVSQTVQSSAEVDFKSLLAIEDDRILIVNAFPTVLEAALRRSKIQINSSMTYREGLSRASERMYSDLLRRMKVLYVHYEAGRFGSVDPPRECRVLLRDVVRDVFGGSG